MRSKLFWSGCNSYCFPSCVVARRYPSFVNPLDNIKKIKKRKKRVGAKRKGRARREIKNIKNLNCDFTSVRFNNNSLVGVQPIFIVPIHCQEEWGREKGEREGGEGEGGEVGAMIQILNGRKSTKRKNGIIFFEFV
jgi:hypothetical protein